MIGSTDFRQAARGSIEISAILFADTERLIETPVMVSLIKSLSPLQYGMAPTLSCMPVP
jgi:hypothetical protein